MRIIGDKAIFVVDDPAPILQVLPDVKCALFKGQWHVAVPDHVDYLQVMKNFGHEVTSPIGRSYNWPLKPGWDVRWWQNETAEFFTLNRRAHCHDAMRLGKTLSTLWALDYLQKQGLIKRALVVAPLSSIELAWADSIYFNFPRKKYAVLHASADKRRELLKQKNDIYIVNHDGVAIIIDDLMKRDDINCVILDETHEFKTVTTKKWKILNKLVNKSGNIEWCWGLTGTPTPQGPTDAYGQGRLITPSNYPYSFRAFKDETMLQIGPYKWIPRNQSENRVKHILSPAIRHTRDVVTSMEPCLIERHAELSKEQLHHYNALKREAVTEINGQTVTAVNAAVMFQKLAQAACISKDTPVLTDKGWKSIQDVSRTDLIWDGVEFVAHGGVVDKGIQRIVKCGQINLTEDHKMFTDLGWRSAREILEGESSERFNWPEVRLPYSNFKSRNNSDPEDSAMRYLVMSLRLWERDSASQPKFKSKRSPKCPALWLPHRNISDSWDDEDAPIQNMDPYAKTLRFSILERLPELWSKRYNRLRRVERIIRSFLERYGRRVFSKADSREAEQRRALLQRQLQVGDGNTASKQQEVECIYRDTIRPDDYCRCSESLQAQRSNTSYQNISVQMAPFEGSYCAPDATIFSQVYDIINCGPRQRFVVRGDQGALRIVHNCGCIYGLDGEFLHIDFGPRLKVLEELIEQNDEKVLVFVPFTGALEAVAKELRKRWSVEIVDGGVSPAKRDKIFRDFQTTPNPHVIVAHPGTMAYSLDLCAASLIIWYAPPSGGNKVYQQACARIDGGNQKVKIDIAHISSTKEERAAYSVVQGKGKWQDILLGLIKEANS